MIQRYQKGSRMSQAVSYGGLVYIAGQVAENRKAGIEDQTRDVLGKIDALLNEAGNRPLAPHRRQRLPAGDRRFRCDEQRL
ncbi:enamine deaminase RidA (YjgF/YER057c/UK114 family) [Rhizobium mongolense]|uniref:Enamine deaminase RidA (YjgF/YER057c/UK114 family) n=1 Tax=Rhizobium mongolense TaxID=57676 RepID=A0ABR6IGW8_9HYPH|nr:enamine deaminase RidA (YjgF/YER057c/UK114 family) [Rhizobium mongolense]